jgi:hypothetical protein
MANFSNDFPLSSSDDFPLTERELSRIVCDPALEETIELAFAGLPATTSSLQSYLFLTQNSNSTFPITKKKEPECFDNSKDNNASAKPSTQ